MSVLLIITTGQTDVQLIAGASRREFETQRCAALHEELERRNGEWSLGDVPLIKDKDAASELPASSFQICTPKLDAVLEYISAQDLTLTHALVLDTRHNFYKNPLFAGAILERRLRERLGISIERTTYLEGEERLEDQRVPRDAVVRRPVIARIEEAIRKAIQGGGYQRVVIAATGGMPVITTLVEEIVQLHVCGKEAELLEIVDGARMNPPSPDRAKPRRSVPEPAESFRVRRHALGLIERGDFLGAWGTARHLDCDDVERRWTHVLEWLALFAASLPIPKECTFSVLTHIQMSVRAAIRVELALKSGDIPRAVHGTVAFFEAALWDHLNKHVTRHPAKKRLYKLDPVPPDCLVRSENLSEEENRKRPFEFRTDNGETWYSVFDDDVCAIRLAKRYLKDDHLQELGQAVSRVRELRNDVAHNEPTPELMYDARERMAEANLWSPHDRFLTQPLVREVLKGFGEKSPDRLCEDLIAHVRSRLLATRVDSQN